MAGFRVSTHWFTCGHTVTRSHGHTVTRSHGQTVTRSHGHGQGYYDLFKHELPWQKSPRRPPPFVPRLVTITPTHELNLKSSILDDQVSFNNGLEHAIPRRRWQTQWQRSQRYWLLTSPACMYVCMYVCLHVCFILVRASICLVILVEYVCMYAAWMHVCVCWPRYMYVLVYVKW